MPELPEVEAVCRRLAPVVTGKSIRAVHVLRVTPLKPQRPATLVRLAGGRKIKAVRRRGKNILIDLSGGQTMRVHLRMTGELYAEPGEATLSPAVRIWFELSGGASLVFRDSRALGRLSIGTTEEIEEKLAGLGPEPLGPGFLREDFIADAGRSRLPAKLYLMDQKRIAGLGNIYAAEALFRAEIDPRKPMCELSPNSLSALYFAIRLILRQAVKSATIAYKRPGIYRKSDFYRFVYGRAGELCIACGEKIRRIPQAGRSTYYCPHCQR